MGCRGRCFSSATGADGVGVVHQDAAPRGLTWYFCPAHRRFHALFVFSRVQQPLCGECAVLFFDRAPEALWMPRFDLDAVMSDSAEVFRNARANFDDMFDRIEQACFGSPREATLNPLVPPGNPSLDILAEVPREDSTYIGLGTTLIPHKRIPDMLLLEYRTFNGATAYQPCSRNIDSSGIFNSLWPIDQSGDPLFKEARTWSCIVQANATLPKELRWVLATIYNFSNEMLRPENSEDALWSMRPWLMHWLTVADQLLVYFGIFAPAPEIDWFAHPRPRTFAQRPAAMEPSQSINRRHMPQWASDSSSGHRTLIRHQPGLEDGQSWASYGTFGNRVAAIDAWLAKQPSVSNVDQHDFFDPTPRGYVSPRTRASMPRDSPSSSSSQDRGVSSWSRLDPRAAVFDPRQSRTWTPALTEGKSLQDSGVSLMTDNSDGPTETSASSRSSGPSCQTSHALYGERSGGLGFREVARWALDIEPS